MWPCTQMQEEAHCPPGSADRKIPRWVLSDEAKQRMEEVYAAHKFPTLAMREQLSAELGGTLRQVQVWFQNRRQRDHRQQQQHDSDESQIMWASWGHAPPTMRASSFSHGHLPDALGHSIMSPYGTAAPPLVAVNGQVYQAVQLMPPHSVAPCPPRMCAYSSVPSCHFPVASQLPSSLPLTSVPNLLTTTLQPVGLAEPSVEDYLQRLTRVKLEAQSLSNQLGKAFAEASATISQMVPGGCANQSTVSGTIPRVPFADHELAPALEASYEVPAAGSSAVHPAATDDGTGLNAHAQPQPHISMPQNQGVPSSAKATTEGAMASHASSSHTEHHSKGTVDDIVTHIQEAACAMGGGVEGDTASIPSLTPLLTPNFVAEVTKMCGEEPAAAELWSRAARAAEPGTDAVTRADESDASSGRTQRASGFKRKCDSLALGVLSKRV